MTLTVALRTGTLKAGGGEGCRAGAGLVGGGAEGLTLLFLWRMCGPGLHLDYVSPGYFQLICVPTYSFIPSNMKCFQNKCFMSNPPWNPSVRPLTRANKAEVLVLNRQWGRWGEGRERRGEKRDKVGPCAFPQDLVGQDPHRIFSSDLGIVHQALASRIWFSTFPNNSMNKSMSFYLLI